MEVSYSNLKKKNKKKKKKTLNDTNFLILKQNKD